MTKRKSKSRKSTVKAAAAKGAVTKSSAATAWGEIGPGHLVIAQESLEYGWWEAIVIDRKGDAFTLRYRDYPQLPKFVRHRSAIALMNPPTDDAKAEAQADLA
jgi:hypothetical protein